MSTVPISAKVAAIFDALNKRIAELEEQLAASPRVGPLSVEDRDIRILDLLAAEFHVHECEEDALSRAKMLLPRILSALSPEAPSRVQVEALTVFMSCPRCKGPQGAALLDRADVLNLWPATPPGETK